MVYPFGYCQKCGKNDHEYIGVFCNECQKKDAIAWFKKQELITECYKNFKKTLDNYYAITSGLSESPEVFH
jgi:hypothetical protein